MTDDPIDTFRLSVMQDFLPVGLAMVQRVRHGGASKVVEAFTNSNDPLEDLRIEGEPAAKSLREKLDNVSPGLGNPVMPVKVAVTEEGLNDEASQNQDCLNETLERIETRLDLLQTYFSDNDENFDYQG